MTRTERLALVVLHVALLAGLLGTRLLPAVLGGVTGVVAGLAVSGRLHRLSRRMDERLGAEVETRTGFAARRVAVRAGLLLALLAALFVTTVFVPLLGVSPFVASAAATTGAAAALNASQLRR